MSARPLGARLDRRRYNFDRVTYKIYKDTTARRAFKAGEFDYLRVLGVNGRAPTSARSSIPASSQDGAADKERRRLPGLPHQHAARRSSRTRACARRWGSPSTSNG